MPEKTLKESTYAKATVDEKVKRAKVIAEEMTGFCLDEYMRAVELSDRGVWQMRHADCEIVEEALTALEERVKELEKDKLTLFERQALSVVLTWQDGGWNNNERLRKAMLVFYATCKEQYPDIIYGIRDLSEEAPDGE